MLQFVKYGLVGGINFVVSTGLFLLMLKVFLVGYIIAFTITWLCGIVLTYVINFVWVFKPEEQLEYMKRMPKYFLVYVVSFVINLFLLRYIVQNNHADPFWAQMSILPLVVVINFFGFKMWALK